MKNMKAIYLRNLKHLSKSLKTGAKGIDDAIEKIEKMKED